MNYQDLPDLLTTAEVADILRVDNLTVRRYIQAGRINCYRLPNNGIRIPKREIEYLFSKENK